MAKTVQDILALIKEKGIKMVDFKMVDIFFIDNPPFVFLVSTGRSILIISQTEDSFHRLTYIEPRDYRVVFVIQ